MGRHNNIYVNSMVIMFICFIFGISILHIGIPDREFSEEENRILEKRPHISFNKIVNGRFASDFENYVSDQFPGRNMWIGVKSDVERAMGKKENNGVFLGRDGYMFQGFKAPDGEEVDKKLEAINSFAYSMEGVNKYFMLVPNSVKVLEDKLPKNAPIPDQLMYMDYIREGLHDSVEFVDVYDMLYSKKDQYIYYKTDHHWTSKGAYYGYRVLAKDMGLIPRDEDYFEVERVTDEFYGSLYSKSGFRHIAPDGIDIYIPRKARDCKIEFLDDNRVVDSIYDMDALKKKDKYEIFLGGNYPLVKITVGNKTCKSLLMVKDSYANSLVPFLMEHYDRIYLVDLRYFRGDLKELIGTEDIGDVLILYNVITFFEDRYIEGINKL